MKCDMAIYNLFQCHAVTFDGELFSNGTVAYLFLFSPL